MVDSGWMVTEGGTWLEGMKQWVAPQSTNRSKGSLNSNPFITKRELSNPIEYIFAPVRPPQPRGSHRGVPTVVGASLTAGSRFPPHLLRARGVGYGSPHERGPRHEDGCGGVAIEQQRRRGCFGNG